MKADEGRPLAPPDGASLIYVSSALCRRSKKLAKKLAKNNIYRSKIKIPTLYFLRKVDSCLHCKFRNGAWRPRAVFQVSVLLPED